jgi:hypothetical protein
MRNVLFGQASRCFHSSRLVLAQVPIGNPEVQKQITELVKKNKVVVFMKGDREAPKCGFSNAVVQILKMHGVDSYDTVDVLASDDIRQGMFISFSTHFLSCFSVQYNGRSSIRSRFWYSSLQ